MEKQKKKDKDKGNVIMGLYASNSGRWLLAIIICVIAIAIVYATRPIFFYLHDTNMMKTYSGYRTGIPTAEHSYGNMIIGYMMYGLYSITNSVPWYTIFAFGILILSIVVICKSILSVAYNNKLNILWPVCLFAILFVTTLYYQVSVVLYTVNASITCCAAIALLFSAMCESNKKIAILETVFSCILMIIGSLIRYSSFRAGVCFWVLAMCVNIVVMIVRVKEKPEGKELRRGIITSCILIVCVFASTVGLQELNSYLRVQAYPEGFSELNNYRAKFMDYNVVSYNDAPELYEELGWSEVFYNLVKSDYFMDEKYNTESLKSIYEYTADADAVTNGIYETVDLGRETGKTSNVGFALTCVIISLSIILLIVVITRKKSLECAISFLGGVLAVAGCLVLCVYLCWQGRFPVRAYQSVAFPTIIVLIFSNVMLLGQEKNTEKNSVRFIICVILTVIGSGSLAVSINSSMAASYNEDEIMIYLNNNARYGAMVQYAQAHPDNIYIHDITISGDQRVIIDPSKENAVNLILWGGTNLYTTSYYRQLELLGKIQIQTENFFDDDVYYMTGQGTEYIGMLESYLKEEYGNVQFNLVDKLDEGVRIFKICMIEE